MRITSLDNMVRLILTRRSIPRILTTRKKAGSYCTLENVLYGCCSIRTIYAAGTLVGAKATTALD
jgi:hypothetical protein